MNRIALYGTPIAMGVVSVLHPLPRAASIVEALRPDLDRWLAVHVLQLFLVPLLAVALWFLVARLRGVAASTCRVAAPVFIPFEGLSKN
jgi:hypothetical protein